MRFGLFYQLDAFTADQARLVGIVETFCDAVVSLDLANDKDLVILHSILGALKKLAESPGIYLLFLSLIHIANVSAMAVSEGFITKIYVASKLHALSDANSLMEYLGRGGVTQLALFLHCTSPMRVPVSRPLYRDY